MRNEEFYERFCLDLGVAAQTGHNPYYHVIQSGLDAEILIDGQRYIDLASNNYLGIANHPALKAACKNAIDAYGASLCSTPIVSGYSQLHHDVESILAQFTGMEQAIIYPSCYQANLGLFNAIVKTGDIALVDRCVHSSLLEGLKHSGCKISPFKHNDMDYLEMLLKQNKKCHTVYVVTESVFSTEGTIAKFADIVRLCETYDAIPVVDDSHGIGVLGKHGRGILEHAGIQEYQGIYTASLGKALANIGGVIAGKASLIEWMKYYSSHLVYSTSVIPSALAGIKWVINHLGEEFDTLSRQMWKTKKRVETALQSAGFELTHGQAPITSIMSGNTVETIKLVKLFWDNRILTTPFVYPSVPVNGGRIRIIAGADMGDETLQRTERIISHIGSLLR